jgi:hypothetical protein
MTMWLFIQAVGKKLWALLSCAAFTILGAWAEYFSKNNLWIVKANFVLAGLFLLVGCFLAWSDEHRKVNALQEQLTQAERDYFDARPRMGINVTSEAGIKGWNELTGILESEPQGEHLEDEGMSTLFFGDAARKEGRKEAMDETDKQAKRSAGRPRSFEEREALDRAMRVF